MKQADYTFAQYCHDYSISLFHASKEHKHTVWQAFYSERIKRRVRADIERADRLQPFEDRNTSPKQFPFLNRNQNRAKMLA